MAHPSQKRTSPQENPFTQFTQTYRLAGMSDPRRKPLPPLPFPPPGPSPLRLAQPLSVPPSAPPRALPRQTLRKPRRHPLKGIIRALLTFLAILLIIFPLLPEPALRTLQSLLPVKRPVAARPLLPVQYDYVSSPFGLRWGRMHQGIDLAARSGAPVYAMASGRVLYSGWESGYGQSLVLDHGNGVKTRYAHCSRLLAPVGGWVSRGSVIAKVGSTGHSTGPHLHFEVLVKGIRRNPAWYYVFPSRSPSRFSK